MILVKLTVRINPHNLFLESNLSLREGMLTGFTYQTTRFIFHRIVVPLMLLFPYPFWFQLPVFYLQVPRGLLLRPQAMADTVPHHPKPLTPRGWPGQSLLTAQKSSVSSSSMQMWPLLGNPVRTPQASVLPCLAPRASLWTTAPFLGQLSELSHALGVIASIVRSW